MTDSDGLQVEFRLLGRAGRSAFTCLHGTETVAQAMIDLSAARHADKVKDFIKAIVAKISSKITADEVEALVRERVTEAINDLVVGDGDDSVSCHSQATTLVDLASEAYLFCTPDADPAAYATITDGDSRNTWSLGSKGFRLWLVDKFYEAQTKAPGSQALTDAINTLSAKAFAGSNRHDVHLRLARRGEAIWLDLGDRKGTAVEITAAGWRVVPGPEMPIPFIRRRGSMALPVPTRGGSVQLLRPFVNVGTDHDWALLASWLVCTLRPDRPFPVLDVTGEQGSAKTTTTRVLRMLIDPHKLLGRTPPRDPRDLFIAANNSWIVAFDNVSTISAWLSDALCTLATGGGFATRELYSDDDEKLFSAMRPVMLNSIAPVVERSDLLDRSVSLVLPQIPEAARQEEESFWRRFDEQRAQILGALLDAASVAQDSVDSVRLPSHPRMADFARWGVAAEPALGLRKGTFLAAYMANRAGAHESAIDVAAIGAPLLKLIETAGEWTGTASELLDALEQTVDERTHRGREWPKNARSLSGHLRRLAPNFREIGVHIDFAPRSSSKRQIVVSRTGRLLLPAHDADDASDGHLPTQHDAGQKGIAEAPT